MLGNLPMLCLCLCFSWAEARIWAWMLNMPHSPPKEGAKALRESSPVVKAATAMCDHDRACGRGFSCDRHFGLCVPLRGEGHYCRRDAQCVRGLSCMFGKCHRNIPNGQEGARCKVDRDCGASMCCARHHGEQVCKRRLIRGESCFVPDGGLAFSINQICPCDEGLLCRENGASHRRERDFIYQPERTSWTCQVPKV
ncbi:dickkopf-related protein 3-like isoform X1 [Echeneis naucrates]|nr:dickkopf-related protein 3-like isoform X1 [Echeneis naucrates]